MAASISYPQLKHTLSTLSDEWQDRCTALKDLLANAQKASADGDAGREAFVKNLFAQEKGDDAAPSLIKCIQIQLTDRRSSLIKIACEAITGIAVALAADQFALVGAEIVPSLVALMRVTIKAISEPTQACLDAITPFCYGSKNGVRATFDTILEGVKHPHPACRAASFGMMEGLLKKYNEVSDSTDDATYRSQIVDAIVAGARDASPPVRTIAKKGFATVKKLWPEAAQEQLAKADPSTKKALGVEAHVVSRVDSHHDTDFKAYMKQRQEQKQTTKVVAAVKVEAKPDRPSYEKPWLAHKSMATGGAAAKPWQKKAETPVNGKQQDVVIATASTNTASSPKKAASSPKKAASSPKKAASSPKKAASSPKKAASSSKKAASIPKEESEAIPKKAAVPKRMAAPKKAVVQVEVSVPKVAVPKTDVVVPKTVALKGASSSPKKPVPKRVAPKKVAAAIPTPVSFNDMDGVVAVASKKASSPKKFAVSNKTTNPNIEAMSPKKAVTASPKKASSPKKADVIKSSVASPKKVAASSPNKTAASPKQAEIKTVEVSAKVASSKVSPKKAPKSRAASQKSEQVPSVSDAAAENAVNVVSENIVVAAQTKVAPASRSKKEIEQLRVVDLKEELTRLGLPTTGLKAVLVERLIEAENTRHLM